MASKNVDDDNADDRPYLAAIGANTRGAADEVNLDVSGTVGPDHFGQETTTVPGDSHDRPGVRFRRPEEDPDDPRIRRMDTGEDLPVLLESSMRADPVEGTQGTYTQIVEGECARCGYDRLKVSVHTLAGEAREVCNACGAIQKHCAEHGYSMPSTDKERMEMIRSAGPKLGEVGNYEVVDLEPSGSYGDRIALIRSRKVTTIEKDDLPTLLNLLVTTDAF